MCEDAFYDKVKLVHDLSKICWFINKHCKENADKAGDIEGKELLKKLEQDLSQHILKLEGMLKSS